MATICTLCLFVKDDEGEVLLAYKQEGFGEGLINAFGGKVKAGESIEQAAVRESLEEVGLIISIEDLKKMAVLRFYFDRQFKWEMHVFAIRCWHGEPRSTKEMVAPRWYKFVDVPYAKMWAGDQLWLPSVLAGDKADIDIFYNGDHTLAQPSVKRRWADF